MQQQCILKSAETKMNEPKLNWKHSKQLRVDNENLAHKIVYTTMEIYITYSSVTTIKAAKLFVCCSVKINETFGLALHPRLCKNNDGITYYMLSSAKFQQRELVLDRYD